MGELEYFDDCVIGECRTAWCGGFGFGKNAQVKLLVELWQVSLGDGGEEFGSQCGQDAVVAGGVVTRGLLQLWRHQAGVAGSGWEVVQADLQFLAIVVFGSQADANATTK